MARCLFRLFFSRSFFFGFLFFLVFVFGFFWGGLFLYYFSFLIGGTPCPYEPPPMEGTPVYIQTNFFLERNILGGGACYASGGQAAGASVQKGKNRRCQDLDFGSIIEKIRILIDYLQVLTYTGPINNSKEGGTTMEELLCVDEQNYRCHVVYMKNIRVGQLVPHWFHTGSTAFTGSTHSHHSASAHFSGMNCCPKM